MTALEFLRQPQRINVQIEHCLTEMQQWNELAYKIVEKAPMQAQGSQSKIADAVDLCMDREAEIYDYVKKLADVKKAVTEAIMQVDNPMEQDVLLKKHIQGMTLQEIADKRSRNYEAIKTTHRRAVTHLQQILDSRKEFLNTITRA